MALGPQGRSGGPGGADGDRRFGPLRFSAVLAVALVSFLLCLVDDGLQRLQALGQETYDSQKYGKVWEGRDAFDEISQKLAAVTGDTCSIQHVGDLKLPEDTVSHLPDIKEININPVFPNRTALLHLHNMALNRAFFFSYILQSRRDLHKYINCIFLQEKFS